MIYVKPAHEKTVAKPPSRATDGSAGYDLSANIASPLRIWPQESVVIPTGWSITIPWRCVGLIRDRSGLASKRRLTTRAGVIDPDYRGEIGVVLVNESNDVRTIQPGDRIAQLVIVPCILDEIEIVSDLDETARGGNGFGSTGS